jgi:hypothetical protein
MIERKFEKLKKGIILNQNYYAVTFGSREVVGRGKSEFNAKQDAEKNGYKFENIFTVPQSQILDEGISKKGLLVDVRKYMKLIELNNFPIYELEERGLYGLFKEKSLFIEDFFRGNFLDAISFVVQQPEYKNNSNKELLYVDKINGKIYEQERKGDLLLLEIIQRDQKRDSNNF